MYVHKRKGKEEYEKKMIGCNESDMKLVGVNIKKIREVELSEVQDYGR